ncbi:hypothetical protein [Sorangium sp. So ce233]|uniref:hypothetical protein n=1 Tax=Sorangium sp. So ce233 TaxID=3133290 RepID=UPI003F625439
MPTHRVRMMQAGFLASVFAGSGCGLILGLGDFEDASTSGGQGSGGTGGTGICHPDTAERCYSGPPGTVEVGPCRAGIRTCDSSGEMWGACEDETLPGQESCASDQDENCDGFDCGLWARAFATNARIHSVTNARIHSVAVDKSGNIIAVGFFKESIQFNDEPGAESLMSAGETDVFIVSLDNLGKHRWSHRFGDVAAQEATSVSVDTSGNIIVAGINDGTISFGDTDAGPGLFVAKFDNEGNHIWSRSFPGNPVNDEPTRPKLNVTQHGDVIASGTFTGNIEFDNKTLTTSTEAPENASDIYIAKLDGSTGYTTPVNGGWARQFGGVGADALTDAVVDRSNSIVLAGEHNTEITFGDQPTVDGSGMFLTKLDRDGNPIWTHGFKNAHPSALDVDTRNNISVTGSYDGTVFWFDPAQGLPEGQDPLFVAQFDTNGGHRWSRGFTSPYGTGPRMASADISTDADNNVSSICTFGRAVRIDNEILDPSEYQYALVLKLGPSGQTLWKRRTPLNWHSAASSNQLLTTRTSSQGASLRGYASRQAHLKQANRTLA